MTAHWSAAYVGIPWAELGRTRAGCDCWGLVRLVLADRGIAVPSYLGDYDGEDDARAIAALIRGAGDLGPWQRVAPTAAVPFDVAVFRRGRLETHVGVVVRAGRMLHVARRDAAKVERYDGGLWQPRLSGIWRHAGLGTVA